MSFLGLEGLHVLVTGAAGGIGGQAVKEFLGEFYIVSYFHVKDCPQEIFNMGISTRTSLKRPNISRQLGPISIADLLE
jgi:hypothetical protein